MIVLIASVRFAKADFACMEGAKRHLKLRVPCLRDVRKIMIVFPALKVVKISNCIQDVSVGIMIKGILIVNYFLGIEFIRIF